MEPKAPKPSKVEAIKIASQFLKVQLAEELHNGVAHFSEDAATVLKFHGSYQQDDRDHRTQLKKEGKEKDFRLMVRVRVPGGKATAAQYLAVDELARTVGNGTLRITTRQEFQIYGVLKSDLPSTMRRINEILLSTLAACGDVERNVLCCPAPIHDGIRDAMQQDVDLFAAHFAPRASSYFDIWLDGEKVANPDFPVPGPIRVPTAGDEPSEPIYGKAFLPRKFKTAFALPEDNCTDVLANDLGFLAVVEGGELVGYNVVVGGGLGTTPSAEKTFPALAEDLAFVPRDQILDVGEAVMKVYRDHGNRSDRKRARIKYLVYDWGMDRFRATVAEYLGRSLEPSKPIRITEVDDHLGWHEQGDGKVFLGLPVENGRLKDVGDFRFLTGLRTFFAKYGTPARMTCQQSIILAGIDPAHKAEIEQLLVDHGIARVEQISTVRRWSMACPALPTCGLAVTEAERALPTIMNQLEAELTSLGLDRDRFTVRMTGCPNGCARPYNSDIGLVGRSATRNPDGTPGPGTYTIFLGGRTLGDRLNVEFKDYVPFDRVVPELAPILARYKDERSADETFGDYCHRIGVEALAAAGEEVAR
ncbi:NADPH-dependent assimilatory sulfite reductase hemoprotein subunit [Tundrisphaera sp. TA3]|uniref:NADPH-dependent assimilatory sulfite reductase hemoprotein subunit n=1 Tax=Tundrisphaera sp. TA3 TaxID=3435775 RepID=UPI003EBC6BAC